MQEPLGVVSIMGMTKRLILRKLLSAGLGVAVVAAMPWAFLPEANAENFEDSFVVGPEMATDQLPGESAGDGVMDLDASEEVGIESNEVAGCEPCDIGNGLWSGQRCDACDPPYGMVNRLIDNKEACWTVRTESLLLWRNAPRSREMSSFIPITGLPNADVLNSPGAAGPRFSIFRTDGCGDAIEATYFRVANWRAQNTTSDGGAGLFLSNLGAAAQSFELNGRTTIRPWFQLLGGFRWFQWQENLLVNYQPGPVPPVTDSVFLGTINDLYGYQIGFDSLLLSTNWMRVEAIMKGGAYYNRNRLASTLSTGSGPLQATVGADSAAFVGELGMTGVIPLSRNIDFRFGYLAFWLEGLAQPTNQFRSGQFDPTAPIVVDTTGSTVLQGLTLGLEGRW
jgi:hypothetical protein